MPVLDSSHRILLENLESYQLAQQCMGEIETTIWEVAHGVKDGIANPPGLPLVWNSDQRQGWFQADAFPNWDGSSKHLIAVGIEDISVANLLTPDAGAPCRAFIYTHMEAASNEAAKRPEIRSQLSALVPPKGFVPSAQDGYIFVKPLGNLSVDSLLSRAGLKAVFHDQMRELIDWLAAHRLAIEALGKRGKTKR